MAQAWQTVLEASLLRTWSRRGTAARLLWPLSKLFHTLVGLRKLFYRWGIFKTQRVNAFVVVVGNVVVGGAGKTPTVISIVQHLVAQGHCVGVISRGFGRRFESCEEVTLASHPTAVGDEPIVIHRNTQQPVFVCRNRHQAALALLAKYPATKIIVCDDGLQHSGLYRDLEICVFDDRGYGNGWLLPAGPLREPWPAHALAHVGQRRDRLLVLHTGAKAAFAGYTAQRSLAPQGLRQDGSTIPLTLLQSPGSLPLMAVAGIAQPGNFFSLLQASGLIVEKTLALPDHYDFDSFSSSIYEGYQLICTEKDAAKLWAQVPSAIAVALVQSAEPAFFSHMDSCLTAC